MRAEKIRPHESTIWYARLILKTIHFFVLYADSCLILVATSWVSYSPHSYLFMLHRLQITYDIFEQWYIALALNDEHRFNQILIKRRIENKYTI